VTCAIYISIDILSKTAHLHRISDAGHWRGVEKGGNEDMPIAQFAWSAKDILGLAWFQTIYLLI
jgi:hypothetical protein